MLGDSNLEQVLEQLCEMQRRKVLACGQQFIPYLTEEDVLQPMDFPELEQNPYFRYEEGILSGMLSVQAALKALEQR